MARRVFFGNLNKAQVAIRFPDYPLLNITAEALGENMVSISSSGEIAAFLPTGTGFVSSPNPALQRGIAFAVVKTNPLCQLLLNKIKANSVFGEIEVTTDSSTLDKQMFQNATVQSYDSFQFNGKEPALGFSITCFEAINNDLFGS